MTEELLTWDKLATFSGLVMSTSVITSFLKGLCERIPTQLVSWIVAFILVCIATIISSGMMPWHDWILAAINSITVSLTANGMYSACTRQKKDDY